jgi:hypothetical protein
LIQSKNYGSYDLVTSDYKGVEIMDGDVQYYIIYSKLGFGIHHAINICDLSLSEKDAIEMYKSHYPIVVKSKNYAFSTEDFTDVFLKLLHSICEYKIKNIQ